MKVSRVKYLRNTSTGETEEVKVGTKELEPLKEVFFDNFIDFIKYYRTLTKIRCVLGVIGVTAYFSSMWCILIDRFLIGWLLFYLYELLRFLINEHLDYVCATIENTDEDVANWMLIDNLSNEHNIYKVSDFYSGHARMSDVLDFIDARIFMFKWESKILARKIMYRETRVITLIFIAFFGLHLIIYNNPTFAVAGIIVGLLMLVIAVVYAVVIAKYKNFIHNKDKMKYSYRLDIVDNTYHLTIEAKTKTFRNLVFEESMVISFENNDGTFEDDDSCISVVLIPEESETIQSFVNHITSIFNE